MKEIKVKSRVPQDEPKKKKTVIPKNVVIDDDEDDDEDLSITVHISDSTSLKQLRDKYSK